MIEELSCAKNAHEESLNEQVCTLFGKFSLILTAPYQLRKAHNEINEERKAVEELSRAKSALEQSFEDQVCLHLLFTYVIAYSRHAEK